MKKVLTIFIIFSAVLIFCSCDYTTPDGPILVKNPPATGSETTYYAGTTTQVTSITPPITTVPVTTVPAVTSAPVTTDKPETTFFPETTSSDYTNRY